MKRQVSTRARVLLLLLLAAMILAACGGDDDSGDSETGTDTPAAADTPSSSDTSSDDTPTQATDDGEPVYVDLPLVTTVGEGRIGTMAVSPDGSVLALGLRSGEIRLYDLADMSAEPRIVSVHTGAVNDIVFSPDGSVAASASTDLTTLIWSPETGEVVHTLPDDPSGPFSDTNYTEMLAFSPDGAVLVGGKSTGGIARLWDAASGDLIRDVNAENITNVTGLTFLSDDALLIAFGNRTVQRHEIAADTTTQLTEFADFSVFQIAASPDGSKVVGIFPNTSALWAMNPADMTIIPDASMGNASTGTSVGSGGGATPTFSADGAYLAVARSNDIAILNNNDTLAGAAVYDLDDLPTGFAFTPDGGFVAVTAQHVYVTELDAILNAENAVLAASDPAVELVGLNVSALSPDGTQLAANTAIASAESIISIWDVATGEMQDMMIARATRIVMDDIGWVGDTTRVYARYSNDIAVVDTATGEIVGVVRGVDDGVVAPGGQYAFLTARGGEPVIYVIDLTTLDADTITNAEDFGDYVAATIPDMAEITLDDIIAASPDGSQVALRLRGTESDRALIVNMADFSIAADIALGFVTNGFAISPDGTQLATTRSGEDAAIVLYTIADGSVAATIPTGYTMADDISDIHLITYTDDGAGLLLVHRSGHMALWDLAAGTEAGRYRFSPVSNVQRLSADGTQLVTVNTTPLNTTGVAYIWDLTVVTLGG